MPTPKKPKLTQEALHESLKPPNNCQVKIFQESLDADSLAVFNEALGYHHKDYPASAVRQLIIGAGYSEAVPGNDAIGAHRRGVRPCRCKG